MQPKNKYCKVHQNEKKINENNSKEWAEKIDDDELTTKLKQQ